ncbi:class I SAM-dependent methyltransferase [Nocardia higoensis]|uniref:class I SAM-dependent methyltransferase n=1 Tax=Nocardia higoensis TaxID=228599 RepID=UPI0002F89318|nr:class I SAM-dependent methyltransferase [Nocardia higoensis]
MDTVRDAYDEMAGEYAEFARGLLENNPFERAPLDMFAESVGAGPVADLGCGEGRISAYLAHAGLDVSGIDLSPRMIAQARAAHPGLRFEVGSLERTGLPSGTLAGLLAWYSLIHLPPERIPGALAEFARVLRPGGYALLGFQAAESAGDPVAFDHAVVRAYRWWPERLADAARAAGFEVVLRMVRAPRPGERFDQASLLLRKTEGELGIPRQN